MLKGRVVQPDVPPARTDRPATASAPRPDSAPSSERGSDWSEVLWGTKRRQGMVEAMAKQAARTVGSEVGRQILRGVLGGKRRR